MAYYLYELELCLYYLTDLVDKKLVSATCGPAKCGRESPQIADPKSAGAEITLHSLAVLWISCSAETKIYCSLKVQEQQHSGALRTWTTHARTIIGGRGQYQWYSRPNRLLTNSKVEYVDSDSGRPIFQLDIAKWRQ